MRTILPGIPWKVLTIVLWAGIPFCWQPLWGQAPGVGVQVSSQHKQKPKSAGNEAKGDRRGTKDTPFVVDTKGHKNTDEETAEDKKTADRKDFIDTWTLRLAFANTAFTFLLMVVGIGR